MNLLLPLLIIGGLVLATQMQAGVPEVDDTPELKVKKKKKAKDIFRLKKPVKEFKVRKRELPAKTAERQLKALERGRTIQPVAGPYRGKKIRQVRYEHPLTGETKTQIVEVHEPTKDQRTVEFMRKNYPGVFKQYKMAQPLRKQNILKKFRQSFRK
jgi:hypothetical protein